MGVDWPSRALRIVSCAFVATLAVRVQAHEVPRLNAPIVFDGAPDDEAWLAVPALPLTVYAPTYHGTATQRTEIRVAHDGEYLYAAGRFYDDDPHGVRVNSLYRDRWNGDDVFAIYVDGFNDNRNAKWFGITPAGMRFDQLVSDDGATLNASWDGFWDARTTVTDAGWFAEVRIPFSTLGFQATDGRAVMGLTVTRLISRTGERVTFPDIDPQFEFRSPSHAQDVELFGVRTSRPLYLTPYALGGVTRQPTPVAGGWRMDVERNAGGDLRYGLSSTLTLDATVNTDFAQVEADDQQLALDRFPLFFPEKRRFFQEGSSLFDYTVAGGTRLFHSRRIGLDAARQPVRVLGGARLVGRAGAWDVGAVDLQTGEADGSPSENFGVLRARRSVLNPHSYVGVLATSRIGGGQHNVVAGLDSVLRLAGDEYLSLKWAGSADEADQNGTSVIDRSLLDAKWQRRRSRGLNYTLELLRLGPGFRPDSGFLPRADVTTVNASANWFHFTDRHRVLRRVFPGAIAFSTFRNRDRVLESGQYAAWVQWDTKAGGGGWIEPKLFHEDVVAPFRIGSEIEIPAGRYTFADLQLVLTMAAGRRVRTDLDLRSGTFFDGTRTQLILTPTWNVSRHLELGASWQLTRLRFAERGQEDVLQLASLDVRVALDARASATALVQYDSTSDRVNLNVRLRYNFAEGTDLFVVYNEGLTTDRAREPGAVLMPLSVGRQLVVKYSHTFGL